MSRIAVDGYGCREVCAGPGLLAAHAASRLHAFVPARIRFSAPAFSPPSASSSGTPKKLREREGVCAIEARFHRLGQEPSSGIGFGANGEDDDGLTPQEGMGDLENEPVSGQSVQWESRNESHCEDAEFTDDEEEPEQVPLEIWQLRKLASALQLGRRKANIKSLSEEVGLDRAEVLAFLKDPPFDLLTMSVHQELTEQEEVEQPKEIRQEGTYFTEKEEKPKQSRAASIENASMNWMGRKRIKKVHLKTFELVYRKTKRPTNAMIQNLVQLTNVPRKRIVEWFDKRRLHSKSSSASQSGL